MASEQTITQFPPLPQHSYNSPNLPGLLPKSSQGSLGPTALLSLLFPVKYGLTQWHSVSLEATAYANLTRREVTSLKIYTYFTKHLITIQFSSIF